MARKVQMDTSYIFTPSANRITIDKAIPQEKLLLITNLSNNTVIYNFSDPNLKVSSYTRTRDTQISVTGTPGTNQVTNLWPQITPVVGQRINGYGIPANTFISAVSGTTLTLSANITADPYINQNTPTTIFGTVIVLNANTSSMNAADKLQIFVDEYEETVRPAEVLLDPVSKQRVSTAQALIDTDFEYGLQTTKWESVQLISNRPSFYYVPTTPIGAFDVTQTSTSRTTTVRARVLLTGTVTTAANTTVTGTNTRFTSELKPGSLLFSNAGAFLGAIASVTTDTSATLKANALAVLGPVTMFATGQRFADNGSPGTGIFAGSGTLTVSTASTAVTGQTSKFASELTIGDRLFDVSGALIGTIATVISDTSATLTANAAVNASTAAFEISQYTPGKPIFTQYLTNTDANGSFLINGPTTGTLAAHVDFTYDMEAVATATGSIFDTANTNIYPGYFYTGQQIGGTTQATFTTDAAATYSTITVTTGTTPHNLQPGAPIFVVNTNTTAANGNWYVARVPTPTTFEYVTQATVGTAPSGGQIYTRPLGGTLHRPFDGGLRISCATNSPNAQLIRQTRRYFRYQSGKGLQFSTGSILKPSISVDSLVSNGTTVLVTCKEPHFLYPGATVSISGAVAANGTFNGTYVVATDGLSNTQFRYIPSSVPTNTTQATGFPINLSVTSWSNASTRIGMFDTQNGFHFKYDGSVLSVVRRSSVDQLSGTIRVTNGSASVEGINTQFNTQLRPGNMVVIRGQSYLVTSISAASGAAAMTISPEYRGTTITSPASAYMSKTIDYEIPQTDWNIDKCDGTGPSGFNVDTSRMQMLYIDYSWYGAGAIRYGFKDQRGEVIYAHRIANANNKTEAFMRSGNMPARYETNTVPVSTILQATLASVTGNGGTISVADTTGFPTTGYVWIQAPGAVVPELISYSSKTNTSFTISARTVAGGTFANCTTTVGSNIVTNASTFATLVQPYMHVHGPGIPVGTFVVGLSTTTVHLSNVATATSSTASLVFKAAGATAATQYNYSATAPIAVYSYGPQFAPNISHWGSSVIMDGRYDDDKSLIFTAGMQSAINVSNAAGSNVVALISLRVGPSVDSGVTGLLGIKELINRMQLTLASAGISSDGRFLIDIRLNGQVSGGTWQALGGSSLAQVCYHAAGTSISGGESIASLYTNTAGGAQYTVTTVDLAKARDLGNSILGGGTTLNANSGYFPDGPDMLTLVARNIDSAGKNIIARVSWTEAQA
jgi:hypothetical protein